MQAQPEGCKRNAQLFERISCKMRDKGYDQVGVQYREKVKKLRGSIGKSKTRKAKQGKEISHGSELLDRVLGHKPATRPPIVVESMWTHEVQVLLLRHWKRTLKN